MRRGRKKGALYIAANGQPVVESGRARDRRSEPELDGGLNASAARSASFQFSTLFDMRRGGQVWDGTRSALDRFGTAAETEVRTSTAGIFGKNVLPNEASRRPGRGQGRVPHARRLAELVHDGVGGSASAVQSQFVEDGSFVKWRELSVIYTLDQRVGALATRLQQRVDSRRRPQPAHVDQVQGSRSRDEPRRRGVPHAGDRLLPESADALVRRLGHAESLKRSTLDHMNRKSRLAGLAGAVALVAACNDFLTGGELSTDPNRPTQATSAQLFVGIQAATWALLAERPGARRGLWAQQLLGTNIQYVDIYNYGVSEQTTNGFHAGAVHRRRAGRHPQARGADHGGARLALSRHRRRSWKRCSSAPAPTCSATSSTRTRSRRSRTRRSTRSSTIYDSVQALLSRAIVNLAATGPTNVGAGVGRPRLWRRSGEVDRSSPTRSRRASSCTPRRCARRCTPQVVAEASKGITDPADNFNAVFSGNANEQNFWYQFDVVQRPGYIAPNPQFVALLKARNDPRLSAYFNADQSDLNDALHRAESHATARDGEREMCCSGRKLRSARAMTRPRSTKLNQARALAGLPAESGLTGTAAAREILTEEYIADFQSIEAWNLYKRTCTPNLVRRS